MRPRKASIVGVSLAFALLAFPPLAVGYVVVSTTGSLLFGSVCALVGVPANLALMNFIGLPEDEDE